MFTRSSVRLRREDRRARATRRRSCASARSARRDTARASSVDDGRRARLRTSGTGHGAHGTLARVHRPTVSRSPPRDFGAIRARVAAHRRRARSGRRPPVARRSGVARPRRSATPTRRASSSTTSRTRTSPASDNCLAAPLGARRRPSRPTPRPAVHPPRCSTRALAHVARTAAAASCSGCSARPTTTTPTSRDAGSAARPRPLRDARRRSRSPSSREWPAGIDGAHVRARPRRGRLARRQQPRVREPRRAGRLDRGRRSSGAWPSPGSIPTLFLLAFDADGPRRLQLDEDPRRATARDPATRRDLRDRRRPARAGQRPRPRARDRRARRACTTAASTPARCSSRPTTRGALQLYRSLGFTVHRTDRAVRTSRSRPA